MAADFEVVVFTCTFYASVEETRCQCCLEMLRSARSAGVRVVVVDSSPKEAVRAAMAEAGAFAVHKQASAGRKGAALREALEHAAGLAGSEDAWLCWQEAEKADMVHRWPGALNGFEHRTAVVVPGRAEASFRATYPAEQYHCESFSNAYVSLIAARHGFATPLDWHFGPFALRARHRGLWLRHTGELWEAQIAPIIAAARAGLQVSAATVDFHAPAAMKAEEEGSEAFVEKRLMQVNHLIPILKEAWEG